MMDGNYHLRLRTKNIKNDVTLGDGESYFVKDAPYKEHLKSVIEIKDVRLRSCLTDKLLILTGLR